MCYINIRFIYLLTYFPVSAAPRADGRLPTAIVSGHDDAAEVHWQHSPKTRENAGLTWRSHCARDPQSFLHRLIQRRWLQPPVVLSLPLLSRLSPQRRPRWSPKPSRFLILTTPPGVVSLPVSVEHLPLGRLCSQLVATVQGWSTWRRWCHAGLVWHLTSIYKYYTK